MTLETVKKQHKVVDTTYDQTDPGNTLTILIHRYMMSPTRMFPTQQKTQ